MDEKEQTASPELVKGFNEGYLLSQYIPELADKIDHALTNEQSDRAIGFKGGKAQFQQEKTKDRMPGWLNRDFSKANGKADSKEKRKGDVDLDIERE